MRIKPSQALRFTSIRLTNWRNFRQVDLRLEKRVFFVGPNASGKSNILDSILFLSDIARAGSGGLQAAIGNRGGFSAIRCLHAKTTNYVELDVSIGNDNNLNSWRYVLKIVVKKAEKIATIMAEDIFENGKRIGGQARKISNTDAIEFSQTLIEQVKSGKDYRELSQFLASCRYTHIVPQIVRDRLRAKAEGADPFGGDLLRRIKEMPKKTREPRLRRISEALKIAVPQFENLELRTIPKANLTYSHLMCIGEPMPLDSLKQRFRTEPCA